MTAIPAGATAAAAVSTAVLMDAARRLPEMANTLMVCIAPPDEYRQKKRAPCLSQKRQRPE